jgi:hypothetical protein
MKKEIFESNPSLDCLFETADGECFFTIDAAKAHAFNLADKAVKTCHRDETLQVDASADTTEGNPEGLEAAEGLEATEGSDATEGSQAATEGLEAAADLEPKTAAKAEASSQDAKKQVKKTQKTK